MTNNNQNLDQLRDEVLKKLGRNLYNFQQIEKILKHLISNCSVSGNISNLEKIKDKKTKATMSLNMGVLVGQLIDNIYITKDQVEEWSNRPVNEKPLNETRVSFNFNIETTAEFIKQRKSELKSLVNERNHLVHHLFTDKNIHSFDDLVEVEQYLDNQRIRVIKEYSNLLEIVKVFESMSKEMLQNAKAGE